MTTWPAVSVIMPVLNESRHLAASVGRILDQDYPGPIEVVIAVGPSSDDTRDIADALSAADPRILIVDNPTGKTPAGLNRAIAAASSGVLVRVDGHGELQPGYITTAVETLQRTGAANVGGIMDAQGLSDFEQAVAVAYTSRLGLGGSSFHLHDSPEGPHETVFLGAFRRDAVEAVGGYDECMWRAQDWELNHRLIGAGEVVWFTPHMRVTYRPRSSFTALARQFFETGKWRREVVRRYPETASPRYLAPPIAVAGIALGTLAGAAGGLTEGPARVLRLGWLAPLGYAALIVAGSATMRRDMPVGVRARLPLVLGVMHMAWGAGFLVGLTGVTKRAIRGTS